jgi:hypothetical protein
MPIHSERRDADRVIIITVQGAFDAAEVKDLFSRQEADNTWTYSVLWDLRQMLGRPSTDDLWSFSREYAHDPHGRRPARGPVAVVTDDDDMYRTACLYAVMAQERLQIDVFRQIDEAEKWLADRRPDRQGAGPA